MHATGTQGTAAAAFDPTRSHTVLRFVFGVTSALVAQECLQWLPTFLAPVLVAVLLVSVPIRPPIRLAVGFLAIMAGSALGALLLSNALLRSPLVLCGVAAVIVFRGLYAIAEGKPRLPAMLLLICVSTIPVVALESPVLAGAFAFSLVRATALAIVIVWIAHLIWPASRAPGRAAAPEPLPHELRLRSALLGTAIVAPMMLVYLMFGLTSGLPVVVATTMIVVNLDFQRGRLQAAALVAGNVAGGLVALVLSVLLATHPSLVSLTVLTALTSLAFGWRVSAGDALAPVFLVACNATLIVFTSSLLTDQGTLDVWLLRLTQFAIAGAFTVGMMILMWPNARPMAARLSPAP